MLLLFISNSLMSLRLFYAIKEAIDPISNPAYSTIAVERFSFVYG
ncbi:MAG: hypothetical protein ACLFNJ_09635 [Bacteroidales bacterium]